MVFERPPTCTCGAYDPCPVHRPPVLAYSWHPVLPDSDGKMRRVDQLGREIAYATRAGTWHTWFGVGFINRPDIVAAMNAADDDLRANGILNVHPSEPREVP